ncbi:MAG: 3-oxoacyl-ACP reductase FabG [Bdellovibrionales bacterium]|nr:3-oxoacyl-ACP reductase FabG [Bdellovibrionales bacterium]
MAQVKYSFAQRGVVITGGAQGIGLEIAKRFLEAGADVTIADYSEGALQSAKIELKLYPQLKTAVLDVTDRASCARLAESFTGPLHILVNNAGITRDKSFAKMTDADFDQVIQTNLTGVYNVTKALLGKFDPAAPKRIINMASVVALYGNFGQTNYAATKAGVVAMTKTWAKELARKGFTSNAIAPGFIRTKMTEAMPKEVLDGIAAKVPVGRMGETSEIANTCLFLASDEAAYINGTVISVDGGLVI